ncbi:efflux transporter outer membrane subunit [Massilia aerilata]|uniref:Efflux transporter outer membrane subunit n=1 Tax=Massilia aerilata TaxID=453817 RepID=A0ABW0RZK5_9BURK
MALTKHLTEHLAGAAFALLAAGCALQPAYQRPAPPVAAAYPDGPAYRASAGADGHTPDEIGWRDFLPDPRLQRLVELALRNNRDLRAAVLNVERVRAQYRVQQAALFPQLGLGASAAAGSVPGSGPGNSGSSHATRFGADLSASWEPDFFGRLHSLSNAAFEQYLASAQAQRAAQILLVSQLAEQYLTMLAYGEELAVTERTLAATTASWKIVKLQYDTGVASELDLRQSQSAVDLAGASHAAQLRLQAQAQNGLVLLVGQPLPADLPPPLGLNSQRILADVPAGLPSDLLARRPDILEAEALLRAETADIGTARAAFFPNISLTGSLGTASSTLASLFSGGAGAWTFAASLLAPIFDGGANRANLDLAIIQRDIGVAQYEKAIQTAFREVADGLAARGTYTDQLAALQRNEADQQRRLELANMRYANGVDSYLNVLTAQTDLYNAQIGVVTTRLNRLINLVDLYRALGGGWRARTGEPACQAGNS